jgi:hypothetical protein
MKKKILLGLTLIVSVSFRALSADPVLPDGMTILTPEGVVVTTVVLELMTKISR